MDSYFSLTKVAAAAAISFYALFGSIFFTRKSSTSHHHENNKTLPSSSSTLLAPTSPSSHNCKHHVFPSFHGADVRTNFLSHVVKELKSKGIDLFIDNDIERSKSIGPELVEAIRGSRIAIVLLSKNYASSTWCLNELVEIIKCREELGQTVMPLFYQVDPTDVKKQTGDFGKVFKKTCKRKSKEEIQRWKRALTEVAQVAGFHSSSGKNEAEMIEDIATDVSNKLNLSAPCTDFDGLVGMESKMTEMRSLLQLDSDEVRIVGILGSPGIGKTTIARAIFNRHSQDFQLSIFMDNIKRKYAVPSCSDDYSVKLYLQEQLMSQLTNEKNIKIPHLGIAKDRLKDKKVLVVLDDVDRSIQLEAMAKETSWFGHGSRIIITTQDETVLKASGIDHVHRVNLPSDDEALQIFCMYAFGQKDPKDGFKELACQVRYLIGKLPLGLRVMGSYFRGMSEQDWKEELPRLRTHLDRDGEIASILKFSYDALNDEDKSLFLHIACFFNSLQIDIMEDCLAKCFSVRKGLRVLSEKSLIHTENGRIYMAKLLVQLGRQIVQKESGKRQFLNNTSDIGEVLSDEEAGSNSVIGILLELPDKITLTGERAFERFSNLQFLRIFGLDVNPQSINYISQKLRVLIWSQFQMSCFPSSFNPEFLVQLRMRDSCLKKLWKENKLLNNLKLMDLSFSYDLEELPDLSTATNLYALSLSYCSSLVELSSSIGNAINLQKLDLSGCSSLVDLPSSMRNLPKLSKLELKECSKLEVNLANINLESLEELDLSECYLLKSYSADIQEPDPWKRRISRLKFIKLSGMKKLVSLPQLPDSLSALDAENCESLERLDCSFCSPDIRLNFTNCFKLNQQARDLIVHTPTNKYAVFPAEEVPMCFTDRSSGSSLTVNLNQLPVGKSTRFKACIIVERVFPGNLCTFEGEVDETEDLFSDDEGEEESRRYSGSICCSITSRGNSLTYCKKKQVEGVLPGHLCTFEVEVETEEVTSTELLFDFGLLISDSKTWTVNECGILQLPEVPSDIDDGVNRLALL
ncbi:disease resistance protein TAO1 [Raphanus sativus]|uniref:ADP-ribosyl cyclase/cyclic ADP-ribose hydrolase n=1 Tax=Raphanus sativus TaxID=3726 RepID=A0A6J0KMB7_RAPSA|nr:disease resistance protein TAO1 [Raphanus sativus]